VAVGPGALQDWLVSMHPVERPRAWRTLLRFSSTCQGSGLWSAPHSTTSTGRSGWVVMQVHDDHGCPWCGTIVASRPYDVQESVVQDLPFGEHPLVVVWRKRRYRCAQDWCEQQVFTERSAEIVGRRRSTQRLRRKLAEADAEFRPYRRVAAEYRVS
jgi:zinc-finger of transposase IS204/IS1001/IS1096/IS1165